MKNLNRRSILGSLLVASTLLLAACGAASDGTGTGSSGGSGSNPGGTTTSTSTSSSTSTLTAGSQINGGCTNYTAKGGKGAGESCTSASDCAEYCCACANDSDKSYTGQSCVNGKCQGSGDTCSTVASDKGFCH